MTEKPVSHGSKHLQRTGRKKRGGRDRAIARTLATDVSVGSQDAIATTKAAHKPGVMDLFQQRISASGLPIAPQFLSAARRAELENSEDNLADAEASLLQAESTPPTPTMGSGATSARPLAPAVHAGASPIERAPVPRIESITPSALAPTFPANAPAHPQTVPSPSLGASPRAPINSGPAPIRGVIAADSLVFPEIARSREEFVAQPTEWDARALFDASLVNTHSSPADSREARLPADRSRWPMRPADHRTSRWWLGSAFAIAIAVSLLVFDYRALLATRAAPISSPPLHTEASGTHHGLTETRKSINLPDGKRIDVRINGPIANLVAYLMNRAAPIGQSFLLDEITFEQATSEVSPQSAEQIRQIAQILQAYPNTKARIDGHIEASNDTINARLITAERAATVRAAIVLHGIDHGRIEARGVAADRSTSASPLQSARHHRIELVITSR
jgi:outer membrane protein OmpA-like peptidoglycan-associated protein